MRDSPSAIQQSGGAFVAEDVEVETSGVPIDAAVVCVRGLVGSHRKVPWRRGQSIANEAVRRTCYGVLLRREDVTFPGWWMPCRGRRTVAECAGLSVDAVYSVVCLCYPASASLLGDTEVTVYFFFDKEERLIRHWADEFTISL